MYVVGKPGQKITRGGETVDLKVGEAFPEAATYPTFKSLLNTGCVVWVPEEAAMVEGVPPSVIVSAQKRGPGRPRKTVE